MTRQAIFAVFLLVLDAGYFYQALALPVPFSSGEPGPAFMPLILVVMLAVSALGVLIQEVRGVVEEGGEEPGTFGLRSVALIALTAGFAWTFEPLGYWIATAGYTFAVAWLFEDERVGPARAVMTATLIAGTITLTGWLFFQQLFDLMLPEGYL